MMPSTVTKVSLISLMVLVGLVACQNEPQSKPELKRNDVSTTEQPGSARDNNQENLNDNNEDSNIYNDFGRGPRPNGPNRGGFRGFNEDFGGRQGQQNLANPMGGLFGNSFDDFPFGRHHRRPEGGMMPPRPSNLLSSLLGVDLFEPFRRTSDMFERRFQDMTKGPGFSVEKFYRNGVAYERTCTTKRLGQENQLEQQQQQQQQQQQLEDGQQEQRPQLEDQLDQQQDGQRPQESEQQQQQQQQQQQPQSELKNQQQQQQQQQDQPQV